VTFARRTARTLSSLALASSVCLAIEPAETMRFHLHGSIVGLVTGPSGSGQMGATVLLLNKYDQLVKRTLTNERGAFGFDFLAPDAYSVRVSQTSFAPASKNGVRVDPGMRSFLSIRLASMASAIRLSGAAPNAATLMSDEWKWALRASSATRPILRWLPKPRYDAPGTSRPTSNSTGVFSETRGLLKLSAGEMGSADAASVADLGTGFALATSMFGSSRVLFSGNVGYSSTGVPAAGFRTSYRRLDTGSDYFNPEVKLTVKQVFLPTRTGDRMNGVPAGGLPALRSMSASAIDRIKLSEFVEAEIGASLDSVSFLNRLNYLSPYAVAGARLGNMGMLELGFSSGLPPAELRRTRRAASQTVRDENFDLNQNVAALGLMPRLSISGGEARLQRSTNYEIAYRRNFGRRSVTAGVYRESISNAALTIASSDGVFPATDVLPDFNSHSGVFNAGRLDRMGFSASASQSFGDALTVEMIFSRGGVLRTDRRTLDSDDPSAIRSAIRQSRQNAVTSRVQGRLPGSGTRYLASYQWTDYRALSPGHMFLTGVASPDAGLNLSIRQPVPAFPFMSGRMELTAEMRNLLAQGYLPLETTAGRRLMLIHTPRAVRGGLSFFF